MLDVRFYDAELQMSSILMACTSRSSLLKETGAGRVVRVADGVVLERLCTETYREFESHTRCPWKANPKDGDGIRLEIERAG